ncbi:hypothetical protein QBC34DRAFT_409064 [Podospora aff. communis PSN243]|uniref:RNA recognition motif-containing protein n=1 Tax=Podospora aff. communis PSN243 TaxID=3040156 RepID=A0AAV9GIN1_9PEZI|nr:hypothetical protein QBC34DRAFT_409064 [Podospora aff. communis PSN243]
MAARPGEDIVATLFGDIHYFYGPPTDNPPHHRFDKGSYVYLFEDVDQRRARIEIANYPGTEDQDAFDGYLDTAHLTYSYKHTCMVTLAVGEVQGHDEWHLPTYDPHNQNKYHYKLHSLDIYFWTPQDAAEFVNGIRRVLPVSQCEILDEPGPPPRHTAEVSQVVQQLERAAIDDYIPTPPSTVSQQGAPMFPGPPISAVSAVSGTGDSVPPPPPQQFSPIPYNPAAPAAPEQIRHREKTPPPDDGVANPLHQTLAYDAATPFSPGLVPSGVGPLSPGMPPPNIQHPPGAPTFAPPPVASPGFVPQGFGSLGGHPTGLSQHPTAHPGLSRAATMPVTQGGLTSPGLASPYGSSIGSPYTPGSHTPTPPGLNPVPPPPVPQSSQTGAGYTYQPSAPSQPQQSEYNIHQQFYVPEGQQKPEPYKPKQEQKGKLEEKAGKLEKGVTGLLKRVEKKFG